MGFIVYHPAYLEHDTGLHPESPQRLISIMDLLEGRGVFERHGLFKPAPASVSMVGMVHPPEYIRTVKEHCSNEVPLDPDTVVSKSSFNVALLAAGGAMSAVDKAIEDGFAFAMVRPPGHHARPAHAMGFCLFNNIAIAAKYARSKGMQRILIIDWDIHHGNGTQEAFYDDPCVLYLSVHQYPWFPGTGWMDECGMDGGMGYSVNVPLPAGSIDADYLYVFKRVFGPLALQFDPDIILVSAGQDAHLKDPLAWMEVTSLGFGKMASIVKGISDSTCGKVALMLEGGYDLNALAGSVYEIIHAFEKEEGVPIPDISEVSMEVLQRVREAITIQRRWWDL